jgi:lipid II:glycine glycyltransferase (peptidoglycan interpeptide bridge formation enzyme)
MWPDVVTDTEELSRQLTALSQNIKQYLPNNTFCIRFDPALEFDSVDAAAAGKKDLLYHQHFMQQQKFLASVYNVQPPDSVILDLSLPEEMLLTQMKGKCRYNIKLAEKNGVKVRVSSTAAMTADMDTFYDLYETTAKRDRIAIHGREYYESLLSLRGDGFPEMRLYFAEHDGEALAAIITLFSKREAVYLYGASSNNKRNLMPAYLLQWQAIRDAKQYGAKIYDFYGIPPSDDEKHPMHGLYRFKTGFGGKTIHRIGSIDMPLSWKYPYYRFAETFRAVWYKQITKLFKRR